MKHRPKLLALAAAAAVAGLGVFVSSGIGGDSSAPVADSIDLTVSEPKTVSADELKLVDTGRTALRGANASRKSVEALLLPERRDVHGGAEHGRPARDPLPGQAAAGRPAACHAPAPGLAITNSSRTNPIPGGPDPFRRLVRGGHELHRTCLSHGSVHLTCVGKYAGRSSAIAPRGGRRARRRVRVRSVRHGEPRAGAYVSAGAARRPAG